MKSRSQRATKAFLIGFMYLMYAGAVIYGDIMFLQIVSRAFPSSGFLQSFAYAGAVVTAGTALALPLALHYWFAPGNQYIWGVIYWVFDAVVLGLNSILAYQIAIGHTDPIFEAWRNISPATPLFAVIGIGVAFLLDPTHAKRHAEMEGELDQIDLYKQHVQAAANSPEVKAVILQAAKEQAAEYARNIYQIAPSTNGHKTYETTVHTDPKNAHPPFP
jgi:hypothetical protein